MPANTACPGNYTPSQLRASVEVTAPLGCSAFPPLIISIPWDGTKGTGTYDGVSVGIEATGEYQVELTLLIDRGACSGSKVNSGWPNCSPFFVAEFFGPFPIDCCPGGFGSSTTFSVSVSAGTPIPTETPPPEKPLACPPADSGPRATCRGGSCASVGGGPSAVSLFPVRYASGALELSATDLHSDGFGIPWGHTRRFNNLLEIPQTVGNGMNWTVDEWPFLVFKKSFDPDVTTIYAKAHPGGAWWFDRTTAEFEARFGERVNLELDSVNQLYRLTEKNGYVTEFSSTTGMFKKRTDSAGNAVEVTAVAANGYCIAQAERTTTVGSDTITEQYLYQYTSPTGNLQLSDVTIRRRVNSGAWEKVLRTSYTYYTTSDSHGSDGDLKTVITEAANGSGWIATGTTLYRYYTDPAPALSGPAGLPQPEFPLHLLKFVVLPDAFERLAADPHVSDPLTANDSLVAQYADHYFEYDDDRRVKRERVDGGSRQFDYERSVSTHADEYNHWKTKTVESRPDGSELTVYSNFAGQTMLSSLRKGSDVWTEFFKYDEDAQLVLQASPSAVSGYDDQYPDLLHETSGEYEYLRDHDGLITLFAYHGASGKLAAESVQQGQLGTPTTLREIAYAACPNDDSIYFPSEETEYPVADQPTEATVTSHSYTFHSGTCQIQEQTTTLPVVPSAQNGSGVAASRKRVFDLLGNLTWTMDERGIIARQVFDPVTGGLVRRVEDVDTTVESGVPSGWTTPTGAGLNLVTDFEIDALGRPVQQLGPQHTAEIAASPTAIRRATWSVYDDVNRQIRSAVGYATGGSWDTLTLVNPVSIRVSDQRGQIVQSIQATRSSTSGKLLPSDSFSQSSYVRWTTFQYSDCCQLSSQRVYHDIPASGSGSPFTHYSQTEFGYDSMRRRDRTISPSGKVESLTFDARGLMLQTHVGFNDNGNTIDNVLISEFEYDGGVAGGDGNLTKQTQHVTGSTVRVTQYLYDWRNRQIATDGELDFYERHFYDNLGREVMIERRDGSVSGQLLSRDETLHDTRGRVYRTIRHGVDPNTGNVTGQQTQHRTYDQGHNLLRQEPAGGMEYQEFEYDSLGRRIKQTDPLDHERLYAYDAAGNLVAETDPDEEIWTRGFDPLGRLVRSTNPLDDSTTYGYNNAGDQITVTNALNETTTTSFDAAGRRVSVSDPLSKLTTYTFDAGGNQASVTDPNDLTTIFEYDYHDRLIKVTDPLEHSVQYEYNRAGELIVETDAKNQEETHAYDALGRKVSTTDRLNQTTTFAWNALGLQESLTDAESQTTSYVYDEYQRPYQTIMPDHVSPGSPGDPGYGIKQIEYDSLNRVLRTTNQLGDTVTYNHDAAGRLLSQDYRTAANSPSGTIADSNTFTRDALARILTAVSGRYSNTVTLAYDAAGRQASNSLTISGQTYTSTTQYDAAGRASKLIYPDGSEVTWTYTARGQIASVAVDSVTIDTRTYDDGGRMTSSSYQNGVSELRSYNDDSTLASISYSGAAIGDLTYGWDANKNKTSESIGGVMSGYGFSAGYDAEDRLASWDRADTNLDQSWNLSPVGDWNSITENSSVQNRTHGPAHELLTAASQSVEHDPKGNMTLIPPVLRPGSDPLKLRWDFDDKLRAADTNDNGTDDVFYRWDALGRRVSRDDGTNHTIYFQDGQQTLADYAAGTAASSPTYNYVHGSYIDEILVRTGSGGNRYYHRNQQYSITALTDGGGAIVERYAYTAYGQVTFADASGTVQAASASNNRYTYTGREWDEGLNLYHFRARMYDAVVGRFCSRDPVGYSDGMMTYGYVGNNPASWTDAMGLERTVVSSGVRVRRSGKQMECWLGDYVQNPDWEYEIDGCSPPAPQTVFYYWSFATACNNHDICYQTCGSDQKQCDLAMYVEMQIACAETADYVGFWASYRCNVMAQFYYTALRMGGFMAHSDRQKDVCAENWRPCYYNCPNAGGGLVLP